MITNVLQKIRELIAKHAPPRKRKRKYRTVDAVCRRCGNRFSVQLRLGKGLRPRGAGRHCPRCGSTRVKQTSNARF